MNNNIELNQLNETVHRMETGKEKPFAICRELADKVADLMEVDDPRADRCLHFIARTFEETSCNIVKLAIENCFVYHLGTRIFTSQQHTRLLRMLPKTLHDLLMRQMTATGL